MKIVIITSHFKFNEDLIKNKQKHNTSKFLGRQNVEKSTSSKTRPITAASELFSSLQVEVFFYFYFQNDTIT